MAILQYDCWPDAVQTRLGTYGQCRAGEGTIRAAIVMTGVPLGRL